MLTGPKYNLKIDFFILTKVCDLPCFFYQNLQKMNYNFLPGERSIQLGSNLKHMKMCDYISYVMDGPRSSKGVPWTGFKNW